MPKNLWMLPEGVQELLPPEAERVEVLRRKLLDLYSVWGYQLVQPPLIEYLDSLLTGTGQDLDLQTFKLIDQTSGRTLGVRADITPQVSRIDAHRLKRDTPTRLCYCGSVLNTRGDAFGSSRNPMQLGAELYGHSGIESDVEVIQLMLQTLSLTGLNELYLDLGHIGIFRALAKQAKLDANQQAEIFAMLQRKSSPELHAYLAEQKIDASSATHLAALLELHGDATILESARTLLKGADAAVNDALDYLQQVGADIAKYWPQVTVHYDLAEFRAYNYQTGIVFAAYLDGHGQEIARGGRYDEIGKVFGNARPATGFSTDLNALAKFYLQNSSSQDAVFAPAGDSAELLNKISELRAQSRRVVQALPGQSFSAHELGCSYELSQQSGEWDVISLSVTSRT